MAFDVQPITGTAAAAAMRLSNFATGQSDLLPAHLSALDSSIAPVIRTMAGPWVDLFGYASRVGDVDFNQQLSQRRLTAVRDHLATYSANVNFQMQTAFGASQSTGETNDNDGYWRAVEVYVYASRPNAPEPPPPAVNGSTKFEIRVVGGGSAAVFLAGADNYIFQIVDLTNSRTAFFFYTGAGWSVSIPKIPGAGSMTYAGPPTSFETTLPVELYQFNSKATLFQDPGANLGPLSFGGTLRLSIDEIQDAAGNFVSTRPSTIPIEGGSGLSMPGLGSSSSGVLALISEIFPFNGY